MYCTRCGTWNDDTASHCTSCGNPMPQAMSQAAQTLPPGVTTVPNHLTEAILVTLCCCVPFGIPAIVYAAQVNSKLAVGDVQGALHASKNAKMWVWIAFGCGVAVGLVYALIGLAGGLSDLQ